MDVPTREKYKQVPVSMSTCFVVEFLICHTLLLMVSVLVIFFATQLGLFDVNPIWIGQGSLSGTDAGLWMSITALEGIILIISRRYAMHQVAMYREVLKENEAEAETMPVGEADPEHDLPTVHAAD